LSTHSAKHSRSRSAAQVLSSSRGAGRSATAASVLASRPTGRFTVEKNDVTKKTCISDSMAEELARYTRENGYSSESDCIREILKVAIYGPDHVLDLHRARIEALAKNLAGNRP
jgi:hypothetical protein